MASHPASTPTSPHAVLAAVCLAALILPMSFSGGAVATPAIASALGGTGSELTWITNAFMLTFGSLLMVAGSLADRWGRKRVFASGTAIFAIVSAALVLAPSVLIVDVLRAAQGIGAAAALAGGTAALAQEFEGRARTRAFSLLGTIFGVGLAFGPILAGALIDTVGWRAVFATTAAIGMLALAVAVPCMRDTRASGTQRMDWAGAASFTAALTLFTFAIIEAPIAGFASASTIGLSIGTVVAIALFVLIERRQAEPMLDLTLFRYPRFVGVQLLPIATCYCYVVLLVLLPLRFIGIDGDDETWAGVRMLALSAPMLVVPSIAAWATRWFSAGAISAAGLAIAAAGLAWLADCGPGFGASPLPAMFLIGCGAGLPWGLMDGLSIGVVPIERAGMATGIFSTTRVAGEGIALATVAASLTVLIAAVLHPVGAGSPARQVLAAQYVAAGNLHRAHALLPRFSLPELTHAYAEAFATLAHGLTAITIVSAVAIFLVLRDVDSADAAGDPQ